LKSLFERHHTGLSFTIVDRSHQQPDSPHAFAGLLRARRERPRCGTCADQHDESAPPHSITSSARASSVVLGP
jgi:hypothetical protein